MLLHPLVRCLLAGAATIRLLQEMPTVAMVIIALTLEDGKGSMVMDLLDSSDLKVTRVCTAEFAYLIG